MFWELDIKSLLFYSEKHFTNTFWKELINIWRQYKFDYLKDIDPRCYPLWGTYFLTNQNLISRKYEFEQKGILYINDILTNTGNLYGYEEFTVFYNVNINFLDFYSLMHSVPRNWRMNYTNQLVHRHL